MNNFKVFPFLYIFFLQEPTANSKYILNIVDYKQHPCLIPLSATNVLAYYLSNKIFCPNINAPSSIYSVPVLCLLPISVFLFPVPVDCDVIFFNLTLSTFPYNQLNVEMTVYPYSFCKNLGHPSSNIRYVSSILLEPTVHSHIC